MRGGDDGDCARQAAFPDHVLVAGLDANTHSHAHDALHRGVAEFRALLREMRMVSAWDAGGGGGNGGGGGGGGGDPFVATAWSARTSLQPQACL